MHGLKMLLPALLCALLAVAPAAGSDEAEEEDQPTRYVIEQVSCVAEPEAGAMRGTLKAQVRHLEDGATFVPLVSGDVAVVSATARDGGLFRKEPVLMRSGGRVGVLLSGRHTFHVDMEFASPISRKEEVRGARLPGLPALSALYEVTLPDERLDVTVEPELPVQEQTGDGRTVIRVHGAGAEDLVVRWEPAPEAKPVETIAFARLRTLLGLSGGLVRVEAQLDYSLLQGRMPAVTVRLPVGYSLLSVRGPNVESWETAEGEAETRELTLQLDDPTARITQVELVLEKTLGPVPLTLEVPDIAVRGVARQKGNILVALEKGLQVELLERENLEQMDLAQMASVETPEQQRPALALRYLSRPYSAKLRLSTVEPKVYAEVSCLTVASVGRLRQYWDVQYEIRHAGLFRLKLKLAPGMKLVALDGENINNQSLDAETGVLTVDLRSKAEGTYRLGVQTHTEVEEPERAVVPPLELLGVERQWGTIAVAADSGIAVETRELTGISQIDVDELKSLKPVQQMIAEQRAPQPALAFRYLSFPYELQLSVSHIRPQLKVEPLHFIEITGKNLRYRSVLNYRIKKAGVFQLRLHLPSELRGSLAVSGPAVEDYTYEPETETLTVQLTEKTTDAVSVQLESETLLSRELPEPGQTDRLALPAVYALDTEQERGYVVVGTGESIRLKRLDAAAGLHDVDVQEVAPSLLQRSDHPKLAFRVIRSPWNLNLEVTSISPKIQAQTFNYIRFGEDYLVGASTIDFRIQYAGVKEFRVRLPEGITEPNIRGKNIKIQEKVEEEAALEGTGQLWRVELQSEVTGSYQLIFEYTAELAPKETRREFSGPKVAPEMPEVEREIGYLAVTGDPSLELSPIPGELINLTPVDEEEIPVKFRRLPDSVARQIGRKTVPILFAFRYLGHPWRLMLSAVRHEEADVVTAVLETCKLDTTVTEEGGRITSFLADVRSRYQSFLEIDLPERAQLWHALVNGRRVRPLTDETDAGSITKIPIAQAQGVQGPVRVELQWEEPGGQPLGHTAAVRLQLPSLEGVRVLRLGWILQLPRGYRVVSSEGNLERLSGSHQFEGAIHKLSPSARKSGRGALSARAARQVEDQQQASNVAVLQARTAGKGGGRPASTLAAEKPQLPERFYFQGLILNPRQPATVRALCIDRPARRLLLAAVVLAIGVVCVGFWHFSGFSVGNRLAVLVAAFGVLAGVRVVTEGDYGQFLVAAMIAAGACLVIFGISSAVSKFREFYAAEKA